MEHWCKIDYNNLTVSQVLLALNECFKTIKALYKIHKR